MRPGRATTRGQTPTLRRRPQEPHQHRTHDSGHEMNDARTVKDVHPTARQHPNEQVAADTEKRSGGDDLACLARSLRAEKASSVAFESRLAWLTRILLPPEPLNGPYNQPPPTLQPPRKPNPAKWIKRATRSTLTDERHCLSNAPSQAIATSTRRSLCPRSGGPCCGRLAHRRPTFGGSSDWGEQPKQGVLNRGGGRREHRVM
jgi:hypothetical protein